MTTRIHVVNFGPDAVKVMTIDPENGYCSGVPTDLYAQQSTDIYVHSGQDIRVSEKKA
jgi:hypothetical protein